MGVYRGYGEWPAQCRNQPGRFNQTHRDFKPARAATRLGFAPRTASELNRRHPALVHDFARQGG